MLFAPLIISMLNILINHTMLTRKRSTCYCAVVYVINTLFIAILLNYINSIVTDPTIYKYLSYLVALSYIVYIIIVFSDSLSVKLFSMFTTWVLSTIIVLISSMIYDLMPGYNPSFYIINGTSMIFHFLLFTMYYKSFGNKFKTITGKISENVIYLMSTYMIIALIFLINSSSWNGETLSNAISIFEMLLLIVFIILGNFIVYVGISSVSKNTLLKQNVELLTKQSDIYYKLANFDALTGIANRKRIMDHISEKLSAYKNTDKSLTFIMFDIDKFKSVNDNYGHLAGDEALKFVANRVKNCLREDDFIGRLGGDEFIIISNNIKTKADAEFLIKRIINTLKTPLKVDNNLIYIEISIGVSIFPKDAKLMDDLLEKADQAMYRAKKTVGTTYEFYSN